jgi:cholest-4-en-3-one 26-monooxygenase
VLERVLVQLAEIDLFDPDNYVEGVPHEMFATLRREAPVVRMSHDGEPLWNVTRHADLVEVNRDAERFSSWRGSALLNLNAESDLEMVRLMMLNMDPPEHTKLRKIVNRGFTPRRIRDLSEILERRAATVVDDVIEQGECDFVTAIACELPLQAIADLLGVPQEDRHLVFDWSNRMIGFDDPDMRTSPEDGEIAAAELYAYAEALAAERLREPRDDIVSALMTAEVDGEALTTTEFDLFFLLLAVAGNETTRNAISQGMLALIEHPDQYRRLVDDPGLLDTAVEEILRWASPVMHFRRTATTDLQLGGQQIEEGDGIIMWHISANHDEDVFADPFTFDVGRHPNPHTGHVAFGGGGPHFCLGANLARAELRVMFGEIIRRIPDMELAGDVRRLRSNFINGIKSMPVRFSPKAQVSGR